MRPVPVDNNGLARVEGLVISPYAKKGYIDKQVLSHDAYLKFIEDVFTNGEGLVEGNGGRPDSQPAELPRGRAELGDLLCDFDFTQAPIAPMVLDPCPAGVDTVYSASGPCQP